MTRKSRAILLRRYPVGIPQADDFELVEAEVQEPRDGEVLVHTHFLSMDPAPRMRMNGGATFPPPMLLGETVGGRGMGTVCASRFEPLKVGDLVAGELGWQEYARLPGVQLRRVDPACKTPQSALGVLGPPGITAWFLTTEAGKIKAGDTVVVAGAAGSVGSVAVQLCKLAKARVVGLTGSERQAAFVRRELRADAAVDYRSSNLGSDLAAACPSGVDVFLDSVGGALHDTVMAQITDHARIVVFGFIAAYAEATTRLEYGDMYQVIRRRAELRGFLVGDYAPRFAEALRELAARLADGRIQSFEHVSEGLASAPAAFAALFTGDPVGKQLVRVRSP
ncbi:MAG TPA: NADP-dependent oxidoreductase [Steroidobacteraceae bacterium]